MASASNRKHFKSCIKCVKKGLVDTNYDFKVKLSENEYVRINRETPEEFWIPKNRSELMQTENDSRGNPISVLDFTTLPQPQQIPSEEMEEITSPFSKYDFIYPNDIIILSSSIDANSQLAQNQLVVTVVRTESDSEGEISFSYELIYPSSAPLSLEPVYYEKNHSKHCYCAVGSVSPVIEIWDVCSKDVEEPVYVLGNDGTGHTDAIPALACNQNLTEQLASGSDDKRILLWDLNTQKTTTTITFDEKIECLKWHNLQTQTLLTASASSTIRLVDCRSPTTDTRWTLDGETELKLSWNPLKPHMFIVGTSSGLIQGFDTRQGLLWSISAHTEQVTGLGISEKCLVTGSVDGLMKIWSFLDDRQPELVHVKDLKLGGIHCLELSVDQPFLVSVIGDNNSLSDPSIFDLRSINEVSNKFGPRVTERTLEN